MSGVVFRRLHPHQNPGTGDLPGKGRAPNLGPGMCACARPECRVPLALADLVEFHPHTPLCIPDRLRDRRTGDHQGSLTPHQFPGTRRPRQPLITPRTPTDTPPKRNSTAIPAGGAARRCRRCPQTRYLTSRPSPDPADATSAAGGLRLKSTSAFGGSSGPASPRAPGGIPFPESSPLAGRSPPGAYWVEFHASARRATPLAPLRRREAEFNRTPRILARPKFAPRTHGRV